MSAWQFWIDRGGTFTDIVACSPNGRLLSHKLLSDNPEQYQDAALQGIRSLLQTQQDANTPAIIDCVRMGTTVGTNALLERKVEPVALVTNRGFGDFLRIGYQNRPDIFALNIQRAEPLYCTVIEVDGRISADGEILRNLDINRAMQQLRPLYAQGIRALAIVLMHAWRYPQHELALAEIAEEMGFTQISLSHQVSPLPKLVSRGDTTVVDAGLSPVLKRYVSQVEQGLSALYPNSKLLFMQSNGGLAEAKVFRGRDCVLSGPAGGIIGAVTVAVRAGFDKMIAFDMGGTSTDVAHFAGELERTLDTEVAGIRLRTPMMAIHTVAAGGGSILHFDGYRFLVGPDSAGANPGPACYRRGGPLTVTDANLLLGKLPNFPEVFGPEGDLPPDTECVQRKFAELTHEINQATGKRVSPQQVAAGFLAIAIENMAGAIKKISVQKGYHLADYVLCCYGAASGQHACLLADSLGMSTVLLHPFAGVLSAYGMGLADFRVLKQLALEQPFDTIDFLALDKSLIALEHQGRDDLSAQGIDHTYTLRYERRLALRYQGTDSALFMDFAAPASLRREFENQYHQQFGFCYQDRPLILGVVQVECIASKAPIHASVTQSHHQASSNTQSHTRIFSQDQWYDTPVYFRDALPADHIICGPAIVLEATSTIVIEPDWQGHLTAQGDLLLQRREALATKLALSTQADPVLLEIFNRRFMSVAEQMGFVLQNTAHSVNIKERLDFSCAIFDAKGQMIANAPHIPVHLGSMGESVKALLQQYADTFTPGDAYLLNSPYTGGTHLPDITVVSPVFGNEGQLVFFCASRGHHADIGGITPGSMPPDSSHIDDEGVISSGFKVLDKGYFNETELRQWLNSNRHPARNIEQNIADLQAQIAANQKGALELLAMVKNFGLPVVLAYMEHVQDYAETCVRKLLSRLNSGQFTYTLDHNAEISVKITIDQQELSATIDFTDTSPQVDGNFNAPSAVCKAAVQYVFRTLLDEDIPLNAGCLRPLHIIIPEGSLLNPRYPAAVVAGNVETSQYIVDALYGALGMLAASQGTMNNFTFGNLHYQYYETICGGAGAGEGFAGADAVHTHMTNSRITDPEILEERFPVLVKQFAIRPESGGPGRYRGGDGVVREIEFLEKMTAGILSSHRIIPPFGLQGGAPGQVGRNWLIHRDGKQQSLAGCVKILVHPGDSIRIETPGGGGFGQDE